MIDWSCFAPARAQEVMAVQAWLRARSPSVEVSPDADAPIRHTCSGHITRSEWDWSLHHRSVRREESHFNRTLPRCPPTLTLACPCHVICRKPPKQLKGADAVEIYGHRGAPEVRCPFLPRRFSSPLRLPFHPLYTT